MNRPSKIGRMVAVALVAGISCGIPHDTTPTTLPGGVVYPPLAPAEGRPYPGGDPARPLQTEIFLVRSDHLVTIGRSAPRHDLSDALRLLLGGPTESELDAGIRSAVSPQTTLLSARVDGDMAVVDLSGALVEVSGQEQIFAVAQIVLTATAVPGVAQVRLLLEGEAVEVPGPDGTLTSATLRATDYQSLLG